MRVIHDIIYRKKDKMKTVVIGIFLILNSFAFSQPKKWFDEGVFPKTFDNSQTVLVIMPDKCANNFNIVKFSTAADYLEKKLKKKHKDVNFMVILETEYQNIKSRYDAKYFYILTYEPLRIHKGSASSDNGPHYYFTVIFKDKVNHKTHIWKNKYTISSYDGVSLVRRYFYAMFKQLKNK